MHGGPLGRCGDGKARMADPDRRQQPDRRRALAIGRLSRGRRASDTAAIVLSLRRWAEIAQTQCQIQTRNLCILAAARLEELEAHLVLEKARRISGGQARAQKLSPEQRSQIAQHAAQARHDQEKRP